MALAGRAESKGANGLFNFHVPIAVPLLGRLTHYKGELQASVSSTQESGE